MITALDVALILIVSIFLILLSISLIIIPFTGLENSIILSMVSFIKNIKGNFIISIIGVVILIMAQRLLSTLFRRNKGNKSDLYIDQWTEYGEVKISGTTIIGLVKSASEKFSGLKNIKVGINVVEGKLFIEIKGETSPETNIPEMTKALQERVKNHVETCTGVEVSEIKIIIVSVSQPVRNLK